MSPVVHDNSLTSVNIHLLIKKEPKIANLRADIVLLNGIHKFISYFW